MNEGKINADQLEGFNRMLVSDTTAQLKKDGVSSLAQKKWTRLY